MIAASRTLFRSSIVTARPVPSPGRLHRLAGRIDEPILDRRPVGHLQRGVTESVGQGIAKTGRRRGLPQLDDEVRELRRGPSGDCSITHRTAIGIAICARKIRSSNGSSDVPDENRIHDADCRRIATAPARTGTIWRCTGPLDRSERRPRAMTRSTAPREIMTRWIVSITWAALSLGAMPSVFRPLSSTRNRNQRNSSGTVTNRKIRLAFKRSGSPRGKGSRTWTNDTGPGLRFGAESA